MNKQGPDTPRFMEYLVPVTSLILLLLISSLAQVNFAYAQSQTTGGQFPQNIIVSSSTDTTPNSLKLLATQEEGAPVQEVSGFSLDTTDNIAALSNSQLLVFVSDSSVEVIGAKASSASDQFIDLAPSTSQQSTNAFSIANLPVGVYTLDVLTQKGNTKAAYEGILEIGQQPATTAAASPLSPSPSPSPSPQPATSPVASPLPSTEQSDSVDNGDDGGGDEDNGDEDNDTGNQGEDNGNGGDDGDSGGGDDGDSGGGDEVESED